jgi:excisionase family DNA binding protein
MLAMTNMKAVRERGAIEDTVGSPMMSSERIFIEDVAKILGIPARSVQAMAAAGKIPSAAKLGRRWTFNERAVRTFLRNEEIRCQNEKHRAVHIGAMASCGAAFARQASQLSSDPLTQTIQKLRRDVLRPSKRNSLAA